MSKIIKSSVECAHKLGSMCMYNCFGCGDIAPFETCITTGEQNFPDNCPLEDSKSIEQPKHTYYMNGKRVYPHRTRRNCHYFLSGTHSTNNCTLENRLVHGSLVYPKCLGVRCGNYLRKVGTSLFIPK